VDHSRKTGGTEPDGVADLRNEGALSRRLPGYQERPTQIEMAKLVARALREETPAIIEAPTGVGKSLAYLVPLVRSGKVAIVSTANKALQAQLFFKDIPFVQRHIQWFDAALVKGMGNYVCLARLHAERTEVPVERQSPKLQRLLAMVEDATSGFTGDIDALSFQLPDDLRSRINGDRDQCAWDRCPFFQDCYIRQVREQARRARVIVVNHTLLLLDAMAEGAILPRHDVVILDEAHHLEEEATRAFTTTVTLAQISSLLELKKLRAHTPLQLQLDVADGAVQLWQRLEQEFSAADAHTIALRQPVQEGLRLAGLLREVATVLDRHRPPSQTGEEEVLYQRMIRRAHRLAEHVQLVFAVEQPGQYVYYLEHGSPPGHGQRALAVEVLAAPLDVAPWLKELLFGKCPVLCISATLATVGPHTDRSRERGPNFAYFRQSVGLDGPGMIERVLPLTFDYQSNALLYVPDAISAPAYGSSRAARDYSAAIAHQMQQLVEASRGRAFLLFTSRSMLDRVYEALAPRLSYPLLRQGDLPHAELARRFRETPGAVLFGLRSFWEGVDIAGEALSLVVIDKLPFDPPDDPVHQARKARLKDGFSGYTLPRAVLQLKQGLGRLLRTDNDRGVMAVLDRRLHRGYGKRILRALPPAPLVTRVEEVERFFVRLDRSSSRR
jgi:Rad3-related DNA helicase